MRCRRAQRLLTAAVDRELEPRRRRALDRHLAGCEACRRELRATERMLRALEALPMEAEVSSGLEQATLRRVRLVAADEAETAARPWWKVWLPLPAFAIATAAVAILALDVIRYTGEAPGPPAREGVARATPPAPKPMRRAPVAEPPPNPPEELAAAPELFVNLPILRNLDKLAHFEAIQTTTLDDETPSGQEQPSNG